MFDIIFMMCQDNNGYGPNVQADIGDDNNKGIVEKTNKLEKQNTGCVR